MTSTFHTSRNDFEDGSATFDVYASSECDQVLICEPVNEQVAEELAEALNAITNAFLDCGSSRAVANLALDIHHVITKAKGG